MNGGMNKNDHMKKRYPSPIGRWLLIGLMSLSPIAAGTGCDTEGNVSTAMTDVGPAVADLFGSLGDLVGDFMASYLTSRFEESESSTSVE